MFFTYLIGWSKLDKFYYGVRFADNAHPSDLWCTYFTSSKYAHEFRTNNGEPDIKEIRKIFNSKKSAILWEEKVLRRLKVNNNERWLNRAYFLKHWVIFNEFPINKGIPMPDSQKLKISNTRKNKGLGKQAAINLKPQFGEKNIMKNKEFVEEYKKRITGRRRSYKEDGTWSWSYPNK